MLKLFCNIRGYCKVAANEALLKSLSQGRVSKSKIDFKKLQHPSKVPLQPCVTEYATIGQIDNLEIDAKTIQLLERLSLVDFYGRAALETLKSSIQFADKIIAIDTTNVKPLYTVLENENLHLRNDQVTEGNCRAEILKSAKITDEDYFVSPPGNIPLEQEEKKSFDEPKLLILKKACYLQANLEKFNLNQLEFLPLGRRLRALIEKHWKQSQNIDVKEISHTQQNISSNISNDLDPRLRFIYTNIFREQFKLLNPSNDEQSHFQAFIVKNCSKSIKFNESDFIRFKLDNCIDSSQLVTLHLFNEANGLAKLYSIQRERKIWWMRCSFDPSRYYLQPHTFTQQTKLASNAQSITIKSRLPFGELDVEHITLVSLADLEQEEFANFERLNGANGTNKSRQAVVIHSVIDLDVATCALIFDAADNRKREETMFFNRKLAPYQCKVEIENDGQSSNEMKDLSTHISNIIRRSGLRLFNATELDGNIENLHSDQLGIPYAVVVSSDSLKTGLLKLRSRDTKIKETIHLSDIPNYLLSIFSAR